MGRMILGEPKADKNMVLKLKKKKKTKFKGIIKSIFQDKLKKKGKIN